MLASLHVVRALALADRMSVPNMEVVVGDGRVGVPLGRSLW